MPEINMDRVQLDWCMEILSKIKKILDDEKMSDEDKVRSSEWLVKQALKVEPEE